MCIRDRIKTHTQFATQQRAIPVVNLQNAYLGNAFQVDMKASDLPDLLSNMYLKFTLPPGTYTPQIGRAVLSQINFMIDGSSIEILTDDWYIIRDELFLDADQKLSMYNATGNTSPCTGGDYIVPLELFFCHRKNSPNPYLPTCALSSTTISVKLYFNSQDWITNSVTNIDLENVFLIVEGQYLSLEEKLFFINGSFEYNIPIAAYNPLVTYKNSLAVLNLTANFPVSMMVWFIRNTLYETGDPRFFDSRYSYGYTTKYITSSVPVTYFDGTTNNYIDVIDQVTMYFNGQNVLSTFPDGIYHSIQQPMHHGLSIPTKNIYLYCFTNIPKEFQLDGAIDFTKLDYKTTHLDIAFKPEYLTDIQNGFTLNMYYAGFQKLVVANGRAGFSTV